MDNQMTFISGERRLKAHRKSREGCCRCKLKRIKCSETKPKCSNCLKHSTVCVYPNKQAATPPAQVNFLQPSPLTFSLRDLRLFHNYLATAYPTLPLESDDAWLNDIPLIAQQHSFLMHAILALGGAHLHARTDLELKETVERHRSLAMQGLNALAEPGKPSQNTASSSTQLTALLATSYLLAFTSSNMGDSPNLFLVLVRACASITLQMEQDGVSSPLLPYYAESATGNPHLEVMRPRLSNAPLLAPGDVTEAKVALENVAISCTFLPFQWDLLRSMKFVLDHAHEPFEGYSHFVDIWNKFITLSPDEFACFTSKGDVTSAVLQAHFLGLEALIGPWLMAELGSRSHNGERNGLKALRTSASLGETGTPAQLIRWPLKILTRDSQRFKT